jgi:hypothetical protein
MQVLKQLSRDLATAQIAKGLQNHRRDITVATSPSRHHRLDVGETPQ